MQAKIMWVRRKTTLPATEQATYQFPQFFFLPSGFAAPVQGSRWGSVTDTVPTQPPHDHSQVCNCPYWRMHGPLEPSMGGEAGKQKYSVIPHVLIILVISSKDSGKQHDN